MRPRHFVPMIATRLYSVNMAATGLLRYAVAVLAAAIALLAITATAGAYRPPTAAERAQIVKAVHASLGYMSCVATGTCPPRIDPIRVSVVEDTFATAGISIPKFGSATALVHKKHGTWRVTDLGSADVGCDGDAPKAVRTDLGLACPGGK
jgi:hypothetical protein